MNTCEWTGDDTPGWFETECGHGTHEFEFDLTGLPINNGFKHCPFCGGRITNPIYRDPWWRKLFWIEYEQVKA